MSTGNPTLDSAESASGMAPLNAAPSAPLAPQVPASTEDQTPVPEASTLPPGSNIYVFALRAARKDDSHPHAEGLPDASAFEDVVRGTLHPAGPVRAEEVGEGEWRGSVDEAVQSVRATEGVREVKVYKVVAGVGKAEWHVAGLNGETEGVVVVTMPAV